MSKKSAALARVRQLACLGLPGGLFVASLLPVLRGLTDSDSAAFFWLDASGDIANFYAENFPVPTSPRASALDEHLLETSPFGPLTSIVLASTIDDESPDHDWYRELLRRNGAHFILQGVAKKGALVLGRLALFRGASAPAFGAGEVTALTNVLRYVAHGIGASPSTVSLNTRDAREDVIEQQLVIANRAGQIVHATEPARRLLLLSTGCAIAPRTLSAASSECSRLLRRICAELSSNRTASTLEISQNTLWGRFRLCAYSLHDEMHVDGGLVGIHIRRTQPASLRFVNAMSNLPLSPQQREIALMIANGHSNREIAALLSVSVNTVAYHIKQLFFKLGVHDRAGLLSRIHGNHGLSRPRAGGESKLHAP